jgi:uncharacterized protein (DUF2147 family)
MVIDQRNAGAAVAGNPGGYAVDRFVGNLSISTGSTFQQSTTAPTGFVNSLKVTIGTGGTVVAGSICRIYQAIEGFNVSDLNWGTANASSVALSFVAQSSVTGTFSGGIYNGAANRTYVFTYTVNTANAFEYKTIIIPGDTTGTWATNNTVGMYVNFDLGSGSTYQGTAGTWAAGAAWATSGAVKLATTSGATFYVTGVQLEKGTQATSFDYRPYGTELALCQRYYELTFPIGTAPAQNTAATNALRISQTAAAGAPCRGFTWLFKTTKRNTPATITSYNPSAANANVRNNSRSNDATISNIAALNTMGIVFTFTASTGSAVGDDNAVGFSADAEL